MAEACEGVTVHTMHPRAQRGPVFYASLPSGPSSVDTLKHRLISALWDHLRAMESPLWTRCQSSDKAVPIRVVRGQLGRPHLLLGECRGPAISFSEGGGRVWAALCGDASDVGIDAAGTDEFNSAYPFHRVFHPQELQRAVQLADGDLKEASALLWSVKEAVVKALGSGFHLVDPRQITVCPSEGAAAEKGGHVFGVDLSGKALVRFTLAAGQSLWVHSLLQRKAWLSIALLNRRSTGP